MRVAASEGIVVFVVEVLAALGVLFGVTLLATRRVPLMVAAHPDRPPMELPSDQPLDAEDVAAVRFAVALRGYRMDEVDMVLDRLARELTERDARIAELSQTRLEGPEPHGDPERRPWPSSS